MHILDDSVAQLVARLTPDQKVACSSHVGVKMFVPHILVGYLFFNLLRKLGVSII